jgi:hypothetical protein
VYGDRMSDLGERGGGGGDLAGGGCSLIWEFG